MQLTTQNVAHFKGGQMEIQNQREGYIYRGKVESITVQSNQLQVRFAWLAKGEGYPPLPTKWVNAVKIDYCASLTLYSVSNMGPSGGDIGGSDRICLTSMLDETVILYPPDGSKLDPAKVEGLELAQA